jgi:acylphosphatase
MKRVIAIAKGEVQRVGYRDEVERIARKLNLTGYVENLKPYDVKIVAEGDEEKLKQFIELIKIQKFPIFVEALEVSWQDATGEFNYFEIKRGEWQEELFERLDIAGKLLYKSIELGEKNIELGEKNIKLSEKSVELAEKNLELGKRNVQLVERNLELTEKSVGLAEKNLELGKRNVELAEKSFELGKKNVELIEKNVGLTEKSIELGEKNISVGEKILSTIREESEKTREVIREESEKTREELRLLRSDLREY